MLILTLLHRQHISVLTIFPLSYTVLLLLMPFGISCRLCFWLNAVYIRKYLVYMSTSLFWLVHLLNIFALFCDKCFSISRFFSILAIIWVEMLLNLFCFLNQVRFLTVFSVIIIMIIFRNWPDVLWAVLSLSPQIIILIILILLRMNAVVLVFSIYICIYIYALRPRQPTNTATNS